MVFSYYILLIQYIQSTWEIILLWSLWGTRPLLLISSLKFIKNLGPRSLIIKCAHDMNFRPRPLSETDPPRQHLRSQLNDHIQCSPGWLAAWLVDWLPAETLSYTTGKIHTESDRVSDCLILDIQHKNVLTTGRIGGWRAAGYNWIYWTIFVFRVGVHHRENACADWLKFRRWYTFSEFLWSIFIPD